MLPPSSPVAYPASSSPVNSKRPRPSDAPKAAKPRVVGGFIADDDSDDDGAPEQPSPKRRMLQQETRHVQVDTQQERGDREVDTMVESQPAAQGMMISTPPDSQLREGSDEEEARYQRLFGTQKSRTLSSLVDDDLAPAPYHLSTCSGKTLPIRERKPTAPVSYAAMVAARSKTKEGRASKSYYGIAIHELIDDATKQIAEARKESGRAPAPSPANPDKPVRSIEDRHANGPKTKPKRTLLWTEKYRARTFMDLVGDDLTNRQVLRWLKRWDPIVFPHAANKHKPSARRRAEQQQQQQQQQRQQGQGQHPDESEKPHRKILMLHGPPGLGKTTLAHVCARQAGYEVMEINASDERSKDVVKGRIRTSLGTETVKTVENKKPEPGRQQKVARPVCVVVDEVDGVVGGSGGSGEGGFVKALIDLVLLDQKNSSGAGGGAAGQGRKKKKKGDDFKQMRPLILICNDVYHPSLRPLRQSGLAEVIHVGKPSVEAVVNRLKSIFEKEGIPCEKDAVRKICEASWGMTSGIDAKRGAESNAEGDLRGVMVVGEWVAGRLRATSTDPTPRLTRQWVDKHVLHDLAHGGGGARGLGRGGVKEIVSRIFQEGAGFPKPTVAAASASSSSSAAAHAKNTRHEQPQAQLGFAEQQKKYAMARLGEMIDTSGEVDRITTEVFLEYPNRDFNDDSFLTKPDAAYDWLHFHDACSARLFASKEWELAPYASQPLLACHHLFASPRNRHASHLQTNPQYHQAAGFFPSASKWADADPTDPSSSTSAAAVPILLPFSGPRADHAAYEAEKANRAALQGLHARMPPALARAFRGPEDIAAEFLPYLVRMASPDVKPVVVGASGSGGGSGGGGGPVASVRREAEKIMVRRAAAVLAEVGVELVKGRVEEEEGEGGRRVGRTGWVYRMEPDLDALATFESAGAYVLAAQAPTRYAVRQVLDQELQKTLAQRETAARQARLRPGRDGAAAVVGSADDDDKENSGGGGGGAKAEEKGPGVKRDFFGRVVVERPLGETDGNSGAGRKRRRTGSVTKEGAKVWVTYHEGLNNAVRRPISLEEFLRGF
ncbi:hypothetical protein VTK26DRAFT_1488 [Humicola hyalothermophila]